jgi:hypothetical protein
MGQKTKQWQNKKRHMLRLAAPPWWMKAEQRTISKKSKKRAASPLMLDRLTAPFWVTAGKPKTNQSHHK